MNKMMFKINGLTIKGTEEQIQLYATDAKEFDYVKNSLEIVKHKVSNTIAKTSDKFLNFGKLKRNTYLVAVGDSKSGKGKEPVLMIYDNVKKEFKNEISIDDLELLKNQSAVELLSETMQREQSNMVSEDVQKNAYDIYHKMKFTEQKSNYKPMPLDNSKQSLTSERGFYVGDPSLVLKDDILKRGVREGAVVQTGIYNIDGQKMVITHATNGCHGGHDIYSGTIGVIPLELIDTVKVKNLPSDSLDIRTGSNMNIIVKQNKMYLAQGSIDEIDTKTVDVSAEAQSTEYSM